MDNVFSGKAAKERLMAGINKTVDAAKHTLGAKGTNALLEVLEHPYTLPTNDGISIIESIKLSDPVEQMGANLVKETSGRHNKTAGDGSTTTAVLLQAILQEGMKSDAAPIELKRSLEECLPLIEASIDSQTKEITVDEVGAVATISAEDPAIGALIQEIYQKIGKDGILYPDVSKTFEDHYTLGIGVRISGAGFASPYMADTLDNGTFSPSANYKNPKILVTKQKISSAMELNDIVGALYAKEIKELVIFCDELEATVIPDFVLTRARKGFKTLIIKLPVLWKDWWFEDIAKMTGATVVDPAAGISFKTLKLEHLGTCTNLITDKNDTFLDGISDISDYVTQLRDGSDDGAIRAARLNTKTARLFVGAHSDAALSYKRLKVEDARNCAWQALHGGVVAGGGVALRNAADSMPDTDGGNVLKKALTYPITQIMLNAGKAINTESMFMRENPKQGFNAKTGEIVDMFEAGIIDPANVVKNSIRNALSVAATVLSCEVVITQPVAAPIMNPNDLMR